MRRTPKILGALALSVSLLAAVAACSDAEEAADAPPSPEATVTTLPNGFDSSAAQEYCRSNGGTVAPLVATRGTDQDADDQTQLGEPMLSCRFDADETAEDSDTEGSIYVDLVSLYSKHPTLAALAYLSKTELPESAHDRSAADALCTSLGGTAHFGPAQLTDSSSHSDDEKSDDDSTKSSDEKSDDKKSDDKKADDEKSDDDSTKDDEAAPIASGLVDTSTDDDTVVLPCTFPDRSFIGKWGIAYYASSTVRGTDLADLFRFDAKKAPEVFPTDTK